MQRAATD
jgi:transposase